MSADHVVGGDAEVETIRGLLDTAARAGTAALVVGGHGIAKTAFLTAARGLARQPAGRGTGQPRAVDRSADPRNPDVPRTPVQRPAARVIGADRQGHPGPLAGAGFAEIAVRSVHNRAAVDNEGGDLSGILAAATVLSGQSVTMEAPDPAAGAAL